MTVKGIAARLWLLGWFAAWALFSKRGLSPFAASWAALIFGSSGVVAGLYIFFRGFGLLQRKRWIEDTPVSRISAASLGRVKIFGLAAGPYTLISPLAGVDCYYYRAIAWEAGDEDEEQGREQRAEESISTPLFIEDETGRVLVDPFAAQLEIPAEYEETIGSDSMSECARRFLHRHGLSSLNAAVVSERALKPGDPLLVLGTLRENAPSTAREGHIPAFLSREAADLQRCEQLEAMGIPARDIRSADSTEAGDFNLHPDVIVTSGGDREPFVLARQHPQGMVDGLARSSVLSIWGGAGLAVLSLGLLIKWLGLW